MFRFLRAKPAKRKLFKPTHRRLSMEGLERREVFASGVVDVQIAPLVAAGTLNVVGDGSNNDVEIRQTINPGEYIVSGKNGTLLQLNTGGVTQPSYTINGINGNITIGLADGDDNFSFLGQAAGGVSNIPATLRIDNADGSDRNTLSDVLVNGNFNVVKAAVSSGYSELTITNSTVIGDTTVSNVGNGTGDTKTTIDNSKLQAGGPGAWGLLLQNPTGQDIIDVRGNSQFGTGSFIAAQPIVLITNGVGGSRTTFTGASAVAGPGTTTVYGNVTLINGANVIGFFDISTFNAVNVLGKVNIINGAGDTNTVITGSTLGSRLVAGGFGDDTQITNDSGVDTLSVTNSTLPFGLLVDNDNAAGGASNWGSVTTISGSQIGTRPLGPTLPIAGDAFQLLGDNARDVVNASATTFGGNVNLSLLRNGNNEVNISNKSVMAALLVTTGTGNDKVVFDDSTIAILVSIALGAGADELRLLNIDPATEWPSPLLGAITIDGGLGVDTTNISALALGALGFEIFA